MKIYLPEKVQYIIRRLEENGYEAYAVGGCVRDTFLMKQPDDWDITTSASPKEVKKVFQKTVDTGISHGTVTVLLEKQGFEVTTYRIDGTYEDSRHPSFVQFTKSLFEDLKRRDFTINAMAYNDRCGLVDNFGGISDLEMKCIRCVGDPKERFLEDALRMLRAVRFAAQLGFEIEKNTKKAIEDLAPTLQKVSRERIQVELQKLFMSKHPQKAKLLYETGLSKYALLGISEYEKDEKERELAISMLSQIDEEPILRWSAFLHGCAQKDGGYALLRNLKFDNHTTEFVTRLVKRMKEKIPDKKPELRRFIYQTGEDIFPLLLKLRECYICTCENRKPNEEVMETKTARMLYEEIQKAGDCLSLKMLAVTGNDLIAAGKRPGKEMGKLLNLLLDKVLENPQLNQKEVLLSIIEKK